MPPLIHLDRVTLRYAVSGFSGVDDISLSIEPGTVTAIVGESGSGKSTVLKLIYGLLTPSAGSVYFDNERVLGPDEKLIPGHARMKMVTQDFNLNTYAKVYDNIASMLPNTDLRRKAEGTRGMMELLRIDHLAAKRVADLSGGEQQRVAIARAMITAPEVLLLDEPFSQVDTILRASLREDLRRVNTAQGTTIVLVSHDPADGLSMADQLVILRAGKLVEQGPPQQLYLQPAGAYTARLLAGSTILTAAQAGMLGIDSGGREIGIYPEWLSIGKTGTSISARVTGITFHGFYDNVSLQANGVKLKVRVARPHGLATGDETGCQVRKFVEFDGSSKCDW